MCRRQNLWKNTVKCGSWLSWRVQAVEIAVINQPVLLDACSWDAAHGLVVRDDLFPHYTGGLRQRVINITTVEVIFLLLLPASLSVVYKMCVSSFLHGKSTNETVKAKWSAILGWCWSWPKNWATDSISGSLANSLHS